MRTRCFSLLRPSRAVTGRVDALKRAAKYYIRVVPKERDVYKVEAEKV